MTGLFLDLSLAELKTVDLFRGALAEMCGTFLFLFLAVTAIVYRTGVIVPVSGARCCRGGAVRRASSVATY